MMTLREERNEQNKQAWRAHLEQERLDLSASVEAALVTDAARTQHWQDELDELEDVQPVTGGTGIVPPRISLQSRMLPAVQPQHYGTVTTTSHQAIASPIEEEADPRSAGMLTRLARRFTSSFSAVHPAIKPEASQAQAPLLASERSARVTETYQPPEYEQSSYMPADYADVPLVRVIDTTPSAAPMVDAGASQPKKRRSLKRNGKVRLETTEQPAISKADLLPRVEDQETGETLLAADVQDAVSRNQMSSPPYLNAPAAQRDTSSRVPGVTMPVFPAGSGVFESEQSEVMIVCVPITAASIVLVTLTSNPGPVVVQYISLQSGVGFTVHLTAPVTTRTTFNYVVL